MSDRASATTQGDAAQPEDAAAQALAERVASIMFARDRASQALGMRIVRVGPGFAELTMVVRDDMVNGHSICHGGLVFTLADSTFAFACNSYDDNTVAQGGSIDFLAPAHAGDTLTAVGRERRRAGRTGLYDIEVHNQRGEPIALFRGRSYRIKGTVTGAPSDR